MTAPAAVSGKPPATEGDAPGILARLFQDEVAAAKSRYPSDKPGSAAIELLYLAQSAYGALTDAAIAEVAELLDLPPTQVRGLAGFYTLLFSQPHGRHVIHVCTDIACALRGAEAVVPHVCRATGAAVGATSEDGLFTVLTTTCLAACDHAPVMQVDLTYFSDLTPEAIERIVSDVRDRAASESPGLPYGPIATGRRRGRTRKRAAGA